MRSLLRNKKVKWLGVTIFAAIAIYLLLVLFRQPSLQREWSEESAILPSVTISSSTISVSNIRDWRYSTGTTTFKDYYNDTFALDKIKSTYFVISTFGPWTGVAHTFLVFDFFDGKSVAISMEARREKGVPYSTFKGIFNNYEQWYAWGSAADFIARRAVNFGDPIYMYPLDITASTSKALFLDLAKTTYELETKPKFYNTIFSNCTNVLAFAANRINKGSIPWSLAGVIPGFSDDKLYELKLIPHDKPFTEILSASNLNDEVVRFHEARKGMYSKGEFWNIIKLREEYN